MGIKKERQIESNSDIWEGGVCSKKGLDRKKRCRIKFWDMGKRGVRLMGEMGLERDKKICTSVPPTIPNRLHCSSAAFDAEAISEEEAARSGAAA